MTVFTHSCSDINRCKEIVGKVTNLVSAKEDYLVNVRMELFIMNMFAIVCACQQIISEDNCKAVLDAYHRHIYNRFSHDGWNTNEIDSFEKALNLRYNEYRKALMTTAPPNPLHYLGKYATKHMFGKEYSEDILAIMQIAVSFTGVVKATKEMIQKSYKLV